MWRPATHRLRIRLNEKPLGPSPSLSPGLSLSLPLFLSVSVSLYLSLSLALPLAPPGNHDKSDFISLFCLYGLSTNNAVFKLQFRTFYINSSLGSLEFNSGRLRYRQSKASPLLGKFVVDAGNTAGGRLPGFLASSPLQGGVEPPPNCCDSTAARTGLGWSRPLQPTLSSARLRLCSGQGCPTTRWF